MKTVNIDEFLIEPIPNGATIELDANWLQSVLKKQLRDTISTAAEKHKLERQIKILEDKLFATKVALEILESRSLPRSTYRLDVTI